MMFNEPKTYLTREEREDLILTLLDRASARRSTSTVRSLCRSMGMSKSPHVYDILRQLEAEGVVLKFSVKGNSSIPTNHYVTEMFDAPVPGHRIVVGVIYNKFLPGDDTGFHEVTKVTEAFEMRDALAEDNRCESAFIEIIPEETDDTPPLNQIPMFS